MRASTEAPSQEPSILNLEPRGLFRIDALQTDLSTSYCLQMFLLQKRLVFSSLKRTAAPSETLCPGSGTLRWTWTTGSGPGKGFIPRRGGACDNPARLHKRHNMTENAANVADEMIQCHRWPLLLKHEERHVKYLLKTKIAPDTTPRAEEAFTSPSSAKLYLAVDFSGAPAHLRRGALR